MHRDLIMKITKKIRKDFIDEAKDNCIHVAFLMKKELGYSKKDAKKYSKIMFEAMKKDINKIKTVSDIYQD